MGLLVISMIRPLAAGVSRASRHTRATRRRGRLLLSCWLGPEKNYPLPFAAAVVLAEAAGAHHGPVESAFFKPALA